ncbi:hypothetical protein [Paenibacillus sp. HJGM_3]|uniref:hypothetical protein n=1 Tax=Paenibacillus sp. HJGM_3 TaxID=3379816 RepID=UPI00385B2FE9
MKALDEFVHKLNHYLPVDFNDEENNEYRQYLIDTYLENCTNEKYQFALLAFHMLFMSFLYKEFWSLKTFSFETVSDLCRNNAKYGGVINVFDASIIPELTAIDDFLSILNFHRNKKDAVKEFVKKRDQCAHASGFIQFRKDSIERYLCDVLEYSEKISSANKRNIIKIFFSDFENYIQSEIFQTSLSGEYIKNKIFSGKYSLKDIEYILEAPMPEIIVNDELGDYKIAYFFAMLVLQTFYENHVIYYSEPLDRNDYTNKLYLFLETLSKEQYEKIQVQTEDELNYLKSLECPLNLSTINEFVERV